MSVRSEYSAQVLDYVFGDADLRSFREWHLSRLLEKSGLNAEELELLTGIEARFADLMAGLPEAAFKQALKALLFVESQQAPLTVRSYVISTSPIVVDVSPSCDQPGVTGAYIPNETVIA